MILKTTGRFLITLVIVLILVGCREDAPQNESTGQEQLIDWDTIDQEIAEATKNVVACEETWPIKGFCLPPEAELIEFESDGQNIWTATFSSPLDYMENYQHVHDFLTNRGYNNDPLCLPPAFDGFMMHYDKEGSDLSVMYIFSPIPQSYRKSLEDKEPIEGQAQELIDKYTLAVIRDAQ